MLVHGKFFQTSLMFGSETMLCAIALLFSLINERGSATNRTIYGPTYPRCFVPSSLRKKKFVVGKKCNKLYLGLATPSSG